jgi:hypothetical protein
MQRRLLPNGGGKLVRAGGATPLKSLGFGGDQSLAISDSDFGTYTRTKFAIFLAFRRLDTTTSPQSIVYKGLVNAGEFGIAIPNTNKINVIAGDGVSAVVGELLTTATYTSTSTKNYLLFHYDSGAAAAGDRMRLWINSSTEISAFDIDTQPTLNAAVGNNALALRVGASDDGAGTPSRPASLVVYEFAFFDNALPSYSSLVDSSGNLINPLGMTGLKSLVRPYRDSAVEDHVLTADWTNEGGVLVASESTP